MHRRLSLAAMGAVALVVAVVPAVPASAATVKCGDTITTSVVLTKNLTCGGDGLIVGAPGLTINLNGHTLKGSGVGAAISTINFDYQVPDLALTIKNGTVKGFNWGLHLGSNYVYGSNVYVTDLTFRGNTVAIAQVHIDLWIDESLFQENQRGLNGGESAWHVSDSVFRSNTYAVDIADAEIWFDNNRFVDNATGLRTERTGIRLYGRVNSIWPHCDGLKWPHLVVVGCGRGRVGSCWCRFR